MLTAVFSLRDGPMIALRQSSALGGSPGAPMGGIARCRAHRPCRHFVDWRYSSSGRSDGLLPDGRAIAEKDCSHARPMA
jgi:hypothetical protein